MRLLLVSLSCALQTGGVLLLYWMRVRQMSPLARWDVVVFGGPLLLGATACFAAMRWGRWAGLPFVGGVLPATLLALLVAVLVEAAAMTAAFNIWGT